MKATTDPTPRALSHRRVLILGLCLALVLAVPVAGQNPDRQEPQPPSALFLGKVDVSVVNVEVYVTDADGNPVSGLTSDDFVLLEDGQPVEISNFYAATRPDRLQENLAALNRPLRPLPSTQDPFLPNDQQLNLIVYIDHTNLRPDNRKRVLADMRSFLVERAHQGDNIMLVGYGGSVKVEQPLTREPTRILDALDRLGKAATRRQIDDLERRRILSRMAESAQDNNSRDPLSIPIDGVSNAYSAIRSYVQERRSEMRLTTKALRETLRALAGLPGRKALVYVSDGLPARPGEELYQVMADLFSAGSLGEPVIDPTIEALREDQGQLFNDVIREANAQQVTFYPIDARGPRGEGRLSAEFGNQAGGPAGNTVLAGLREASLQEPLIDLAEATGGATILNTFNFDQALTTASSAFDTFYSLGFTLPEGGDGSFHQLEVVVRHPDYHVRHRSGFQDKPEIERMADRTLSSLFLEANDNPLQIAVAFGKAKKRKKNYELPLMVRIPFRALTLLPRGDQREGRLQIFVAVRDEKGRVSDLHQEPYPLSLTRAQAAQAHDQDIGYGHTFAVRPGTATIAIGVWDEVSGSKSFIQQRVLVGNRRIDGGGRRRSTGP